MMVAIIAGLGCLDAHQSNTMDFEFNGRQKNQDMS